MTADEVSIPLISIYNRQLKPDIAFIVYSRCDFRTEDLKAVFARLHK
jgi:hypothetical protein